MDKANLYRLSRILVIQSYYNFVLESSTKKNISQILNSVKERFCELNELEMEVKFDLEFAEKLLIDSFENSFDLEKEITLHLSENWRFERLPILMQILLKVAISELMQKKTKIVIILSEYTDIASGFFDEKEIGFVNSILNRIAKKINREDEG